jgi:CheY-like chemotaxis protein
MMIVIFPLSFAFVASIMTTEKTETISSNAVVLYVDDDVDDILVVEQSLKRHTNLQLISFSDSYKFLRYIIDSKPFRHLPSLILIDINMPVINGRELLTLLRSYDELKKTKIVLYTTSNHAEDSHFAKDLHAGFVTKPSSATELDALLDRLLTECHAMNI